MKTATKGQIQKLHILLKNLGLQDEKKELVLHFTEGRTDSSTKMTIKEARTLLMSLAEHDPSERLKSIIFSLAYQAGLIYGYTIDDKKMNAAKLNMFLKERGAVRKDINSMSYTELIKVNRQFKAMVVNNRKTQENKKAGKLVNDLLDELNANY
jgi:hypothetical protein